MREILFRGKPTKDIHFYELNEHISRDEFVYGNLIVDGEVCYIVNGIVEATDEYINFERWIPVRKETVGEFTGLPDKNGTKIFEGDIVKFYGKYAGKIVFRIGGFFFEEDDGRHTPLQILNPIDCEVIGNIHDKGE